MKYILLLLLLSSCVPNKFGSQVVIEPIDAIKLCNGKVRSYSALTGIIKCKGK